MNTPNTNREQRAFADKLKSARLGTAEAQYELGLMYANGVGVEQDIEKAVHWVSQAAQRGLVQAQYLLATRYELGIGVERDVHAAWVWYHKAAEQGSNKALTRMGRLYAQAQPQAAATLYERAAVDGNAEAQAALAACLESGVGVARDAALAFEWNLKAANAGVAAAQFAVAQAYRDGVGVDADLVRSIAWYRKAARQDHLSAQAELERLELLPDASTLLRGGSRKRVSGQERRRQLSRWAKVAENASPADQYTMGQMCEQGLGWEVDSQAAVDWYERSARRGHIPAQAALGRMLEATDPDGARYWLDQAAAAGDPAAQRAVANAITRLEGRESWSATSEGSAALLKALDYLLAAGRGGESQSYGELGQLLDLHGHNLAAAAYLQGASAGVAEAQYQLGRLLDAQEPAQAFYWYEQAAHQGHAAAQTAAGLACLTGRGIQADGRQAFFWLQKAAEQGYAAAQWNISVLYVGGREPVKRDLKLAYLWCQRAADQGFVAAQSHLGLLNALMGNRDAAVKWWDRAARSGDPEAQYNLALALIQGDGVAQDVATGFEWLCQAAEQGVGQAQSRVGLMFSTGDGVPTDPVEGYKWLQIASESGSDAAKANLARAEALIGLGQLREARRRVAEWKKYKRQK